MNEKDRVKNNHTGEIGVVVVAEPDNEGDVIVDVRGRYHNWWIGTVEVLAPLVTAEVWVNGRELYLAHPTEIVAPGYTKIGSITWAEEEGLKVKS